MNRQITRLAVAGVVLLSALIVATTLEPPYETNGSVIPVSGISRRIPPRMMNDCTAKPKVRPAASSFEKPSEASSAVRKPRTTKTMYSSSSAAAPTSPSSCAIAAKMKSVFSSGMSCVPPGDVNVPCPSPLPTKPPRTRSRAAGRNP